MNPFYRFWLTVDGQYSGVEMLDGSEQALPATSLFIFIGAAPHTSWLKDVVKSDEKGFILTGLDLIFERKEI